MIYSIELDKFPKQIDIIEQNTYVDENDFNWTLVRTNDGFYIKYEGDEYFKETYFNCIINEDEFVLIKNTNCLYINKTDFDTFIQLRDVLITGYTDDIWQKIEELFNNRFKEDNTILDSEKI